GRSRFFGVTLPLLSACLIAEASAQNADDGYAASVNGTISAVVVLADGKAVIGGSFTQVNGQPCSYLCRLRVDGSIDPDFANPAPDGDVAAIAELADGRLVVGGSFCTIGGQTRARVARLAANGGLDASFADPGID